jgi:intraflagellar transport protein 80
MKIAWSSDSTIAAGAGGSGHLVFGYIVDKTLTYENWEINLNEDNK